MEALIKSIFGNNETLTADEFLQKATESGVKLVDIAQGGFVAKDKADRKQKELQAKIDELSNRADYDDVVKERDELRAEKKTAKMLAEIKNAGIDERYAKFVLSELKIEDEKDLSKVVSTYAAENPQFLTKQETQSDNNYFKFGSQADIVNGAKPQESAVENFNNQIRGVIK